MINTLDNFTSRAMRYMTGRPIPFVGIPIDRLPHIRMVITGFRMLLEGNYRGIYARLADAEKNRTNFTEYARALWVLKEAYRTLPAQDRRDLAAAIVLHDVGYFADPDPMAHDVGGQRICGSVMMESGFERVRTDKVARIIRLHGFYPNIGMTYFPEDLHSLSPELRIQLLILDAMDTFGKPGHSYLTLDNLNDYLTHWRGETDTPVAFFRFRLRHLLCSSTYAITSQSQYDRLQELISQLAPEARASLEKNISQRLVNLCFPVFQELVLKQDGLEEFLPLLVAICESADKHLPASRRIALVSEPNIFTLDYPARDPRLRDLQQKIQAGRLADIITVKPVDSAIIINI